VLKLKLHDELRSFSVRATGHRPDKFTVDGWDRQKQAKVSSTATTSSASVKASSPVAALVATPASAFGDAVVLTAGISATSQDEANQLSAALAQRAAACAVTARGVADGNSRIKLGTVIDVDDAGPLSGKYPVTKVEHIYGVGMAFVTRFVAGDRRPTSLVDMLSGAKSAATPATQHPGLVVGEVTNINDPLKLGRVKVRFPGLSSTDESAWARLVAIGGGKSRGNVFIPEVHDEVLVGFEAGDPRQPVVIGGLFGDKSSIPAWGVGSGGQVESRAMTSRLGHIMELSDGRSPGKQYVMLQLAGQKHTFRLAKDKVDLEVPSGTPVNVKAGSTLIAFSDSGDIKIEGMNISIKATQNLKVEALQADVKASTQLNLEGSAQASLKSAMVQVDGSGVTAIKGGIVQIN
jgi:uncharacterized protein involved in type VI secretion and phage assembly